MPLTPAQQAEKERRITELTTKLEIKFPKDLLIEPLRAFLNGKSELLKGLINQEHSEDHGGAGAGTIDIEWQKQVFQLMDNIKIFLEDIPEDLADHDGSTVFKHSSQDKTLSKSKSSIEVESFDTITPSGFEEKTEPDSTHSTQKAKDLISLDFTTTDLRNYQALRGLSKWGNIPKFSILTSKNGSGKTQLLNAINQIQGIKENVFYIRSERSYREDISLRKPELEVKDSRTTKKGEGSDPSMIFRPGKYAQYYYIFCQFIIKSENSTKVEELYNECTNSNYKSQHNKIYDKIISLIENVRDETSKDEDKKLKAKPKQLIYTFKAAFDAVKFDHSLKIDFSEEKARDAYFNTLNYSAFLQNYLKEHPETLLQSFCELVSGLDKAIKGRAASTRGRENGTSEPIKTKENRYLDEFQSRVNKTIADNIKDSHLIFEVNYNTESKIVSCKKPDNDTIEVSHLSSGQLVILQYATWAGIFKFINIEGRKTRYSTLLLDEPDKHLDPELSKIFFKIISNEFVQNLDMRVIMTTHHTDTISLIEGNGLVSEYQPNKPGIFFIERSEATNNCEITNITKLHAMYKMTKNFREFSGHFFKVYCESTEDALFYEAVYRQLRGMSQSASHKSQSKWTTNDGYEISSRPLSNRYQLGFQSISKTGKQDGGSSVIVDKVERDLNAYDYILSQVSNNNTSLLQHKNFHLPYGIVDNDNKISVSEHLAKAKYKIGDEKFDTEALRRNQIAARLKMPKKRYTLENFMFDPLLFCSLLSKEEITKLFDEGIFSLLPHQLLDSVVKKSIELRMLLEKGTFSQEELKIKTNEYFKSFFEAYLTPAPEFAEKKYIERLIQIKKSGLNDKKVVFFKNLEGPTKASFIENGYKIICLLLKEAGVKESEMTKKYFKDALNKKFHSFLGEDTSPLNYLSADDLAVFFSEEYTKISKLQNTPYFNKLKECLKEAVFQKITQKLAGCSKLRISPYCSGSPSDYDNIIKWIKNTEEVDLTKIMQNISYIYKSPIGTMTVCVQYPIKLLLMRGHSLELCFNSNSEDTISRAMYVSDSNPLIAMDLAEIFFELDYKVRNDMQPVVKPKRNMDHGTIGDMKTEEEIEKYEEREAILRSTFSSWQDYVVESRSPVKKEERSV
jgi:energy-coupling factor transporter ATP-binding protein EcfA2